MRISKHFDSREFACKDGTVYPIDWISSRLKPLCEALEIIRAITGKPLTITSGYRTHGWNSKVNGAPKSQHLNGLAADIKLSGIGARKLYEAINRLRQMKVIPFGFIKLYPSWVHYDIRKT